jgi:two-component sensor histidine kinase
VNILLPVFLPNREPMVLGFNRNAENLSATLLANKMPEGWNVALVDRKGAIIAASPGAGTTGDQFKLTGIDDLAAAPGWTEINTADEQLFAAVQRSVLTGWTLVAWSPHDVVTKPLAEAFWSLLVGGILLAATVILVIYWVALQIGRSVHGLEDDAHRLGRGEVVLPRDYPISEIATVARALSDASRQRKHAEAEVRLLMRELAHRSKNQMTVIAAMAKQTARGVDSVPEFVNSFERRIFGLARSTDLLLAHGAAGVDLRELLQLQVEVFAPEDGARFSLQGPAIRLNGQSAQIIGMAAHELSTNASKYGAFSRAGGKVEVRWTTDNGVLDLQWCETTRGQINRPHRRGFGTTVIENMVGRALGAEVERDLRENGIAWRFKIPLAGLDPSTPPSGPTVVEAPQKADSGAPASQK